MDFKQIEAFISVAKLKSFSKAANTIFLSQPTISSHISNLEKELSIQLFDRSCKEVLLTPAGESFLEYALDIINTRNKAMAHVSSFNDNIYGKLNLAASSTPCNSIIPELIKKFNDIYPDIHFNVREQSSGKIIEDIIRFNCEIGIVGSTVKDDKIKSYKLLDDELVLISHSSLNIPSELPIKSLFKYKFIMMEISSATRRTVENALIESGYDTNLNLHYEVNSLDTLLQFVNCGLGVSIISKAVYDGLVSCGDIKATTIKGLALKRDMYLIISSKRTLTPTAQAFFNLCRDYYNFKE